MKVAVVILNYNGAAMLSRFLPSVLSCSAGASVIIADNASTDDSVSVVRDCFPAVSLLQLDRNYGFAEGYNRALEQVDAEYYMLLNSDVEVTEDWLEPMLTLMESHPDVVACQPKILSYNNKDYFEYAGAAGGFIDRYGYPYCRGRLFDTIEKDDGQYNDACRVFWATGAALMVRRDAFRGVGGFDGGFFAHMEEIDLCWRMLARGGVIYTVPQSLVYHVGGATLNRSNPHKTFLNFRNNLLMLYKNLPAAELRRVMFARALLDWVAALKFLLSGGWDDFKAVLRARREYRRLRAGYAVQREQNLVATLVPVINERARFSLLWQYYIKGKKHYSQLK